MKASTVPLTEPERALVAETQRTAMLALDEDALVDLHDRIRRARTKYVKLYRRQASARVEARGGRGIARPENARNSAKAEVFEDALARVSRRLAVAARDSAAALKAERLAAARGSGGSGPDDKPATGRPAPTPPVIRTAKAPARKKREASTLAAGARRQAKRDNS